MLLNPTQENDASIEGVTYIVNLMARYRWKEKTYIDEDGDPDVITQIKNLYVKIIDFQANLLIHKHHSFSRRWARDVFKAGDWETRVAKLKELDCECKRLTDEIADFRFRSWQDSERKWQKDLLQQNRDEKESSNIQKLYSNYEASKNANPMRVAGTCEWFLGHPDFLAWRQSQSSSLLWVSADPGCGKSVLSKSLIDCKGEALSMTSDASTICYFFFKDGEIDRVDGAQAVCAFLHQLFLQQPCLYKYAEEDFKLKGERFLTDFDAVWNIFVNATCESERQIICVLDALDECQEISRKAIIAKLVNFYSKIEFDRGRKVALKSLVTSRPYANIEWVSRSSPTYLLLSDSAVKTSLNLFGMKLITS